MLRRNTRLLVLAVLVAAIAAGGIIFACRHFSDPGGLVVYMPTESSLLTVQVDGGVAHPGVFQLSRGLRIADAVSAAGGLVASGSAGEINLAAPLHDGQHIRIPLDGESLAGSERININTASAALLETLPGIGEVRANAIVESRQQAGPFVAVHELAERKLVPVSVLDEIEDRLVAE